MLDVAAVYEKSYPALLSYCRARTTSTVVAEDLVQQAFLNAWERRELYKDEGKPPLAYMYRILHNLIIDYYRRNANREFTGSRTMATISYELDESLICERLDFIKVVEESRVKGLRNVLALSEGYTTLDQSKATGVSTVAIRGRIHRARKILSRLVE